MRKMLLSLGVAVVVIIILIAAIPFFLNAERYRPQVEARLQSALGREVRIGHLTASLMSGGVRADDITIADDPAYSKDPFIRASSLDVGVEVWPLIKDRQIRITSLTLKQPVVTLLQSASGKWNFSTVGGKSSGGGSGSSNSFSVQQLQVQDGKISIGTTGGRTQNYAAVNLKADHISLSGNAPIPFKLTADAPNGGKIAIDGNAGPINPGNIDQTPLQANIELKNFDLASTGFIGPDAGIAGTVDYTGKLAFDGKIAHSEGTLKSQKLRLVKTGTPASQPVTIAYSSDYDMRAQTGNLTKGDVQTGKSTAHLSGTYDLHGRSAVVRLAANASNMAVQDITGLLPALGVSLPAGASLQGGTVNANLNITGPVERLVTVGKLALNNTKLANFSLGSSLAAVASLAGIKKGPDTVIQLLSSNLNIGPDGTRADNLNLVIQDLGSVTGSGTVSPNNALNFRMVANLNGASESLLGGLSKLAGLKGTPNRLPFAVQGTTSKPVFVPDVSGLVQSGIQGQFQNPAGQQPGQKSQNPIGDIIGLFGKKK